jgi:hypothetical protein
MDNEYFSLHTFLSWLKFKLIFVNTYIYVTVIFFVLVSLTGDEGSCENTELLERRRSMGKSKIVGNNTGL